jgi:hypothetical protein
MDDPKRTQEEAYEQYAQEERNRKYREGREKRQREEEQEESYTNRHNNAREWDDIRKGWDKKKEREVYEHWRDTGQEGETPQERRWYKQMKEGEGSAAGFKERITSRIVPEGGFIKGLQRKYLPTEEEARQQYERQAERLNREGHIEHLKSLKEENKLRREMRKAEWKEKQRKAFRMAPVNAGKAYKNTVDVRGMPSQRPPVMQPRYAQPQVGGQKLITWGGQQAAAPGLLRFGGMGAPRVDQYGYVVQPKPIQSGSSGLFKMHPGNSDNVGLFKAGHSKVQVSGFFKGGQQTPMSGFFKPAPKPEGQEPMRLFRPKATPVTTKVAYGNIPFKLRNKNKEVMV